jgi:dTDP-4-amino-4,6-dideoxygalactose transaminase
MPRFGKAEIRNLSKVIESGFFCDKRGGFMDQFRADFAKALHAKHAITGGSAMLLMHAIPGAIGAGAGDEIIVDPVVQFHAIQNAPKRSGLPTCGVSLLKWIS